MEIETHKILKQNFNKKRNFIKLPYFVIFFIIIYFLINIIIYILYFKNKYIYSLNETLRKINNELSKAKVKVLSMEKITLNYDERIKKINEKMNDILNEKLSHDNVTAIFNNYINKKYIEEQNNFCKNEYIFYNKNYEEKIKISNVIFDNFNYYMFVYKSNDIVSNFIIKEKAWEMGETKNILNGLNYYSKKKNITNNDIYILDIGAIIGWFTFILGKYGYQIISFEPSNINYYILKKNYCLNKNLDVTLINKGLFTEEKKCYLYNEKRNIGNGMSICGQNNTMPKNIINTGEIILTKLSNYIPYLSEKNLALIKIDVEGSEGKVIESGIELITKYHVPFIFLEFTPSSLKLHGTEPRDFLQMFINNGYKISKISFFNQEYSSPDEIIATCPDLVNLYIIYSKFLENK